MWMDQEMNISGLGFISLDQGFTVLNGAAIRMATLVQLVTSNLSAGANSWNSAIGTGHPSKSSWFYYPIASMGLVYLPTFTIKINQM